MTKADLIEALSVLTQSDASNGGLKFKVNASGGGGGGDVNITEVAGAAVAQGPGTAATALRVELPTDGTGVVGLNAGTNAIGKLAANSGVDIGDVDVTSIIPGVAATSLGKEEDAASASGDTGVAILVKRSDTAASQTTTDGDYTVPVANSNGQLRVGINRTFQTSDADSILKAEDAVHGSGDAGVMALAVANEAQANFAADGDYVPIGTDRTGAPYVIAKSGTITTLSTLTSGNVGGFTTLVQSTVTMSAAGVYSTGDYMGQTTTPQSFASAVRVSGGTGVIKSVLISDKITNTNVAMELWIIDRTFTAPTDNAAWDLSDSNMLFVQAVIPIGTAGWYASSAGQVYFDGTLSYPIKSNGTTLFYALVARGTTPSFTSADLTITLGILQD